MINSWNEWDPLKQVIVGTADYANWPSTDPVFAEESKKTTWKETPVPSGAVPQWIVDETNEDLEHLSNTLIQLGVDVLRMPSINWIKRQGMYGYCPRDRLLVAGDCVVDVSMMYPCRNQEIDAFADLLSDSKVLSMPRDCGMVMDAANVCRLNDTWLFLESASGNRAAYNWLCDQFPNINIELCNFYGGVHIDSTVTPLREGLVVLNASRITPDTCPQALKNWDKIWVQDVVPQSFYQYPYASKWIALNMLAVNPHTVIVDSAQTELIQTMESKKLTVIPLQLRHSRTLGGGFHCVTLDTWRQYD